jgi:hypothetical protein
LNQERNGISLIAVIRDVMVQTIIDLRDETTFGGVRGVQCYDFLVIVKAVIKAE